MMLAGCRAFEAAEHRYKLAPANVFPTDVAKALPKSATLIDSQSTIGKLFVTFPATAAAARMDTPATPHATLKTAQPAKNWNSIA